MNADDVSKAHEKHIEYLEAIEMRAFLWKVGDAHVHVTVGAGTRYEVPYRMTMPANVIVDVLNTKVNELKAELEALGVRL